MSLKRSVSLFPALGVEHHGFIYVKIVGCCFALPACVLCLFLAFPFSWFVKEDPKFFYCVYNIFIHGG